MVWCNVNEQRVLLGKEWQSPLFLPRRARPLRSSHPSHLKTCIAPPTNTSVPLYPARPAYHSVVPPSTHAHPCHSLVTTPHPHHSQPTLPSHPKMTHTPPGHSPQGMPLPYLLIAKMTCPPRGPSPHTLPLPSHLIAKTTCPTPSMPLPFHLRLMKLLQGYPLARAIVRMR